MRVQTGEKKTPDGFYVVVVEGTPEQLQQLKNQIRLTDVKVELIGARLLIFTRSRKIRNRFYSFLSKAGERRK